VALVIKLLLTRHLKNLLVKHPVLLEKKPNKIGLFVNFYEKFTPFQRLFNFLANH